MVESVFGKNADLIYMKEALDQAKNAYERDEVPVGAIVVNPDGDIIARAYNSVEHDHTQRSHAESLAVEQAGKVKHDWRLQGCWVYVTLEPCTMCMGLMKLSRVAGVVYGAESPLFGFQRGVEHDVWVSKNDTFVVIAGVMQEEVQLLLQQFFKRKRK